MALDAGRRQGQTAGNGQTRLSLQTLQQACQHGSVAVGRFYPELSLPSFVRQGFELL